MRGELPQGTGIGLYGYSWDKVAKKRVSIDVEAEVVQRIFAMIAEGHTRFEVAKVLNADGIPTKSGGKWHPLTIERNVTNLSYTGVTYFGKTVREGKKLIAVPSEEWAALPDITPAIITQELFDRAQRVLNESKILHRGRPQNEYLLTGHIRCGYCNSHAIGSCLNHKYRYYHCRATYPTSIRKATCNAGYINADDVEKIVWSEVRKVIEHPKVILADIKRREKAHGNGTKHKVERETADIKRKLQSFDEREKKLISLFEVDSITKDELRARVDKIRADKQAAEKRQEQLIAIKGQALDIDSMKPELDEFCLKVKESLDNCSFINKRLALDTLQVQVIATPEKIDITMSVPLEFTTLEQRHEYALPVRRKRYTRKKLE
jgi:site-specific DNA recombinase